VKEDVAPVAIIEYTSVERPRIVLQDEDIVRGIGSTVLRPRDAYRLAGFIGTGRKDVIARVNRE
jgi:hypothetical protein